MVIISLETNGIYILIKLYILNKNKVFLHVDIFRYTIVILD